MITHETSETAAAEGKDSEGGINPAALRRMHEDISTIRDADQEVGYEMNKVVIVCEPPPITPPCHPVELPPDPAIVKTAMDKMNVFDRSLQEELDALRPAAHSGGWRFERDFAAFSKQVDTFSREIARLNSLAIFTEIENGYFDRDKIIAETGRIDKLAGGADKTLKKMEQDLRP